MINDKEIKEGADIFQQIMLDILQRRAVMEAIEQRAMGKVTEDDTTLKIYAADYVGSQLSDLRKFFETDGRAYKVTDLTGKLVPGSNAKKEHQALFDIWKKDYEAIANQYFFHRQKGYIAPPGISKAALNLFMGKVNSFLDTLISDLTQAGFEAAYIVRDIDSGYFTVVKDSADDFFKAI